LEPLADVLFSLYRGQPDHGPWVVACLEKSWIRLLGEKLAAVCRPVRLDGSNLVIEIRDREWEPAVRSVASALLDKIQAATAKEVKTISFSR
jgi:hypothetical protein